MISCLLEINFFYITKNSVFGLLSKNRLTISLNFSLLLFTCFSILYLNYCMGQELFLNLVSAQCSKISCNKEFSKKIWGKFWGNCLFFSIVSKKRVYTYMTLPEQIQKYKHSSLGEKCFLLDVVAVFSF